MLIRREIPADAAAVRAVVASAFAPASASSSAAASSAPAAGASAPDSAPAPASAPASASGDSSAASAPAPAPASASDSDSASAAAPDSDSDSDSAAGAGAGGDRRGGADGTGEPVEARLVDELRASGASLPGLSLVALDEEGAVVGHVMCSRGRVGATPVVALGPLAVRPDRQLRGVGSALVHAVVGAADALDEPLVALLGAPRYYRRFGFRPATAFGVAAPVEAWGDHFQVRALTAYGDVRGQFAYPKPFDGL
ncbi:GNAT family N-acetyltransferase [Pseudofrankia asymbiotica]|uniref:GNAT family N-acetyltransferase n=1 Tax=Pseudofrankia asymbiotica TaxID=1834516 RepID=UPI001F5245FC|nr:N-acetyltransferase [Pseudofrankia asymbiotica]